MIKLKDLLNEQKSSTIINWLNTYKKDFMNNLKKMGFNPRGFALNQLSIPNSDKTMGGASLPQWYAGTVKKKAFDSASKPQKLVTNPKALDSSVTTDEIILNKKNLVYIDSKAFAGGNFDSQQKLNQSTKWGKSYFGNSPSTICGSANESNLAQYRSGNAQIIAINPVKGKNYNEVVIGKSPNLHLYSTKETATTIVPGTKATPDKVIDKPGQRFQPLIIPGTNFRSNSAQFTDPAEVIALITQRIQQMRDANISIPDGVGTVIINSGTDSMPSNYGGRGNQGLADDRGATLQTIQQWMDAAQSARMVQMTFPSVQAPDEEEIIKGTPGTPPKKVDTPKKVQINHLQVFLKK